jgi:hypothetical protein
VFQQNAMCADSAVCLGQNALPHFESRVTYNAEQHIWAAVSELLELGQASTDSHAPCLLFRVAEYA